MGQKTRFRGLILKKPRRPMGGQQHNMTAQNQGILPRQGLHIRHTPNQRVFGKGKQGNRGLGHDAIRTFQA
jgi:hypothetical protein